MFEYVYVWDKKSSKCLGVWYVKTPELGDADAPVNTKGPIPETEVDEHVKKLLKKYPEPRYLVEGGEVDEPDGMKAAAALFEETCYDEEE
jgi:hypothetical protein